MTLSIALIIIFMVERETFKYSHSYAKYMIQDINKEEWLGSSRYIYMQ